jgi:hypothetical protein
LTANREIFSIKSSSFGYFYVLFILSFVSLFTYPSIAVFKPKHVSEAVRCDSKKRSNNAISYKKIIASTYFNRQQFKVIPVRNTQRILTVRLKHLQSKNWEILDHKKDLLSKTISVARDEEHLL